ncbi:hypothetical protein HO133_006158 [Letharia lupina]|uniref:Uncharacterized protein n=1 Tax=Letharia lupina TaxID=560253 RepID=A0A8H6F7J8_9LECA|nr:uncharacterized protein HO133_006158 [Letharia lupina]KAF6218197.1 hypothetical protein HO133_006158 [Letharia lupina]
MSSQIFREPFNRIRSPRAHPRTSMPDNDTQALSSSASIRRPNFPNTDRVLRLVLLKSVTQRPPGPLRPREGKGPQTTGDVPQRQEVVIRSNKAKINGLLLADGESSSTALTGIMNSLLRSPSELAILVDDIRTALARETDMISTAVHELRHLGVFIEEKLRLAPSVPVDLARVVGHFGTGHWILVVWPSVIICARSNPTPHERAAPGNTHL